MRAPTLATALAALSLACASGLAQDRRFGAWSVGLITGGGGVYAGTTNDSNGIFGEFCFKDSATCYWLLANDIDCNEGNKYPVLVNSDAGAQSLEVYCFKIDKSSRFAFSDFKAVEQVVTQSKRFSIAFPMKGGQFQVSRFSLDGATDAIEVMEKVAAAMKTSRESTRDQRL